MKIPRIYIERFFPVVLAIVGAMVVGSYETYQSQYVRPRRIKSRLGTHMICDFETTNRQGVVYVWATNVTPKGIFYYGTKVTNLF